MKHKFFLPQIIAFFFIIFGLVNPHNFVDMGLSLLLVIYVVISLNVYTQAYSFTKILVFPILVIFLVSSFYNSYSLREQIQIEPADGTYRTDMDDFLKTYYLMEKGYGYYESFSRAIVNNPFKGQVSANLWSWRLPTIFLFWKILPGQNGVMIYYFFLINCLLTLYVGYRIVFHLMNLRMKHFAILAPYLLYPYLHFAVRDMTFLQTEWWGSFAVFYGIYAYLVKKSGWTILFFTLAVSIRELFIIPIIITAFYDYFHRKGQWRLFIIPIVFFCIFIIWHGFNVSHIVKVSELFFTPRLHSVTVGKQLILTTLAFGSWEYAFYNFRVLMILGLFGILGSFYIRKNVFMLFTFALFIPMILVIGTSVYNDYWGILYIPILLISTPLVFNYFI